MYVNYPAEGWNRKEEVSGDEQGMREIMKSAQEWLNSRPEERSNYASLRGGAAAERERMSRMYIQL